MVFVIRLCLVPGVAKSQTRLSNCYTLFFNLVWLESQAGLPCPPSGGENQGGEHGPCKAGVESPSLALKFLKETDHGCLIALRHAALLGERERHLCSFRRIHRNEIGRRRT